MAPPLQKGSAINQLCNLCLQDHHEQRHVDAANALRRAGLPTPTPLSMFKILITCLTREGHLPDSWWTANEEFKSRDQAIAVIRDLVDKANNRQLIGSMLRISSSNGLPFPDLSSDQIDAIARMIVGRVSQGLCGLPESPEIRVVLKSSGHELLTGDAALRCQAAFIEALYQAQRPDFNVALFKVLETGQASIGAANPALRADSATNEQMDSDGNDMAASQ